MNRIATLSLSLLCVLLPGCGSSGLGTVSGVVTVDGTPVTQGTIMFIPEHGKAAIGSIGSDGRYTLTTYSADDGALIGPHKVTILSTVVGASSFAPTSIQEEVAQANDPKARRILVRGTVVWIVPERYSQPTTTDLTADVKSGRQTIDFNVQKK